jgi:hypothetical protein
MQSSLATGYKPFQACSVSLAAGLSIFSLVDKFFFYLVECIRMLPFGIAVSLVGNTLCSPRVLQLQWYRFQSSVIEWYVLWSCRAPSYCHWPQNRHPPVLLIPIFTPNMRVGTADVSLYPVTRTLTLLWYHKKSYVNSTITWGHIDPIFKKSRTKAQYITIFFFLHIIFYNTGLYSHMDK